MQCCNLVPRAMGTRLAVLQFCVFNDVILYRCHHCSDSRLDQASIQPAKLLPVTTLQRKQYGVVLRNEQVCRARYQYGHVAYTGYEIYRDCYTLRNWHSYITLVYI